MQTGDFVEITMESANLFQMSNESDKVLIHMEMNTTEVINCQIDKPIV